MNAKKKTEADFTAFTDQASADGADISVARGTALSYLLDGERVMLYLTVAGLLDAGVPFETTLELVADEFASYKKHAEGQRLVEFFTGIHEARRTRTDADTPAHDIGAMAERCFGAHFLQREELVLLRGLAYTDDIAAILRSAAEILRSNATPTRAQRAGVQGGRATA